MQNIRLRSMDVVIHIRDPLVDKKRPHKPGFALDLDYVHSIISTIKYSRIFVIAQPNMYNHQIVRDLKRNFHAELYQDTPIGDWSFAVMAPILIGSFGTFTWTAAYLSEGNSIHLPYLSDCERGSHWHPGHDLFIHDDPRIVYHDVANPRNITHETAMQVLSRDTIFARSVRRRIDPCPTL